MAGNPGGGLNRHQQAGTGGLSGENYGDCAYYVVINASLSKVPGPTLANSYQVEFTCHPNMS